MECEAEVVEVKLPNGAIVGVEVVKERGAGGSASLKVSLTWEGATGVGSETGQAEAAVEAFAESMSAGEPSDGRAA